MIHNPDLEKIKARANVDCCIICGFSEDSHGDIDHEFITSVNPDIPLLIAAVRERDELIGRLVGALKWVEPMIGWRGQPGTGELDVLRCEYCGGSSTVDENEVDHLEDCGIPPLLTLLREIESPKEPQI